MQHPIRGVSDLEPDESENAPWELFLKEMATARGFRLQIAKHCKTKGLTDSGKLPTECATA